MTQRGAHLDCGGDTLHLMVDTLEHEEQCVASELEETPAPVIRQPEHLTEDPVEHLGQFFGSDTAAPRQLLGQHRETGDVDEAQRAVDLAERRAGPVCVPLGGDPGYEPLERVPLAHLTSRTMPS